MKDFIAEYIKKINHLYQSKEATEHSYRLALQKLLEDCTQLDVINEQKRRDCGAPDLTLNIKDKNIPVAYVETKDIGDGDLDGRKKHKKQFDKYKEALDTIVFTDYLDFHLYKEGALLFKVELAYEQNNKIVLDEDAIGKFESLILKLREAHPQTIYQPGKLAIIMANKAKLIAEAVLLDLKDDSEKKGNLWGQFYSFKDVLNKGLKEKEFADLYSQTVAYGLFAARIHDKSKEKFTRLRAAELIPHTNPFLRKIFQQLVAFDVNDSIAWIIDDLVTIFDATNVGKLREKIGKEMSRRDPMIHFYEEFLGCYDPDAKKKNGVYYTPQEVVEFIVRAIDEILKNDFNLPLGLADTSKIDTIVREKEVGKDIAVEHIKHLHRVQILDPATGTGTFLAEVVGRIKEKQQKGMWRAYVDEHLLPRIHGFEFMMAPYTIAHLKLDMMINWWEGEKLSDDHKERLNIYLTNSLDKTDLVVKHNFAQAIAEEANKANHIKHNAPVMVVVGNPPYSGESTNTSAWIMKLMEDYKKEPNTDKKLNEKNSKWINNDYCKFIRMAQDYVERKGEGIVAYICANSFLDNPTFRGMRWHLLKSFDKIYIVNLHGNAKPKPEKCPDGSKDENVFDITVGTSINIFIKNNTTGSGELAEVNYLDLYGLREYKYAYLAQQSIQDIRFSEVEPKAPLYFFVPQNWDNKADYEKGFSLVDLMSLNGTGIVTKRDELCIHITKEEAYTAACDIVNLDKKDFYNKYHLPEDVRDWKYEWALADVKNSGQNMNLVVPINYRLFDKRFIYYSGQSRGFMGWPVERVMRHIATHENIAFVAKKGFPNTNPPIFVSNSISDFRFWSCSGMQGGDYVIPLYLYPEPIMGVEQPRKANLDENIWRTIENWVKYSDAYRPQTAQEQIGELGFDAEPEEPHFLTPEDIFDYIYGVLHSPHYREKYKEFLKVDFPRIPYPKNAEDFEHYKEYGHKLRELHLMHNVPDCLFPYDVPGSDIVEQPHWRDGRVYINNSQYFDKVPEVAWNMFIGGYQPAQKWLKDRKGRTLSTDEKKHYEKIIYVLVETNHIMNSIDDPSVQVEELKQKVHALEHQLQAQHNAEVHYHIEHLDTLHLGDNVDNKFN